MLNKSINYTLLITNITLLGITTLKIAKKLMFFPIHNTNSNILTYLMLIVFLGINLYSKKTRLIYNNILSALGIITTLTESLGFILFYKFAPIYIDIIIAQPSYINYTYQGAIFSYKIFIYIIFINLLLSWLRYILIIKHKILEFN